ncbi:CLUMA_CG006148, isoform A [Clunio marinus]|uniref:CLUMA_CG006148, isoform A n=1 Tax=Clunio marinus TaxID=568069 RepID=A0A1J1HWX3_9DIPT|nr:CLUMA_CG006148, isoform A [Clunio marinus]
MKERTPTTTGRAYHANKSHHKTLRTTNPLPKQEGKLREIFLDVWIAKNHHEKAFPSGSQHIETFQNKSWKWKVEIYHFNVLFCCQIINKLIPYARRLGFALLFTVYYKATLKQLPPSFLMRLPLNDFKKLFTCSHPRVYRQVTCPVYLNW